MDEVIDDADAIFKIIFSDEKFSEEIERIKSGDDVAVRNAVDGGLHTLFNASGTVDGDVFLDYCLVIAVLAQWLLSFILKRLMQLMTPEALVKYNQLIPHMYLKHYIKFQPHFGIREVVDFQLSKLQRNKW